MTYVPPVFATNDPNWKYTGTKLQHLTEIPEANCRAPKTEVDLEIEVIVSDCISKDTCAPFVKDYHKFAVQVTAYEIVPMIGKGCLMFQANRGYTRRDALSDAGNNTVGTDAIQSSRVAFKTMGGRDQDDSAIRAAAFGLLSSVKRFCPVAVLP